MTVICAEPEAEPYIPAVPVSGNRRFKVEAPATYVPVTSPVTEKPRLPVRAEFPLTETEVNVADVPESVEASVTAPEIFVVPLTVNLAFGVFVPIPTLSEPVIIERAGAPDTWSYM